MMENLMIHDLEDILNNVRKLKNQYHKLETKNLELENQISILKVESEKQLEHFNKIKKDLEGKREVESNSVLSKSEKSSGDRTSVEEKEQNNKNTQIKHRLDGFIEEIDQCIQILQAKG
ncbi:MAG: hypothetical protein H7X99_02235 [Saprospiraceae bacterium]|nr:hypothetical protein [Saprospiraceae bacterium]